jgi:hypothetical protein
MLCFVIKILDVFYRIYSVQYGNSYRRLWIYRQDIETWLIAGLLELKFCYVMLISS